LRPGQRRVEPEPGGQVGVGDEELAVGDQVGLVVLDARGSGLGGVAAGGDDRPENTGRKNPLASSGDWALAGPDRVPLTPCSMTCR
jgi:hypothetical protein